MVALAESMETFEVSQALMAVGSVFQVRRPSSDTAIYTVRGDVMSAVPSYVLNEGEAGAKVGRLVGNFVKTTYEIFEGDSRVASLTFPAVAFHKRFVLHSGGVEYVADGGVFKGAYVCRPSVAGADAATGAAPLEIKKEFGFRDAFRVRRAEGMSVVVSILATIAIHSRFYEMV